MTALANATIALIYSPGSLASDYAASLLRGIESGLRDLGASVRTLNLAFYRKEIERVDRGPGAIYRDDSFMVRDCIGFLRNGPPGKWDYCFGLFHDAYLKDSLMEALRDRCRVIINYPLNLLDQPHRFERALAFCDLTFCAEEAALGPLRARYGDKIRYVPMAADPDIHRPLLGPPHPPKLLFVGSFYAGRLQRLEQCSRRLSASFYGGDLDVPSVIRVIGHELIRNHKWTSPSAALRLLLRAVGRDRSLILSDEEFVRLAAEHGVSIGFSDVMQERSGERLHKARLRDYEATMCGMCHIGARLPELERGFEDGQEILLYDTFDQALDILSRIKGDDLDWRAIGAAARRRAERDHTWAVRLGAAFS